MALELGSKIDILAEGADCDVCQPEPPATQRPQKDLTRWLYPAAVSGGRVVNLFKVLLTNVCYNDCLYCASRQQSDCPRASFTPDELVRAFLSLHHRGLAQGLFLSSALAGSGAATMERLLGTVERLRLREGFQGYVHLKIMPGAEKAAVARALQLADRVSINLEAPNAQRLGALTVNKNFTALVERLRWAAELRREHGGARAGLTTQFVVGAAGESDAELLETSAQLYRQLGLARAYYSAFRPVANTPLADLPPTLPQRELRLYQADFLVRSYGYEPAELVMDGAGNLPSGVDPKVSWAEAHPEVFPIDVQSAERLLLLRVPGIGPRGANAIIAARRQAQLRSLRQLRALGVSCRRAGRYVLMDGRRPLDWAEQQRLWPEVD
ncbi:MAG: radical SAM protein [Chloroflexota bacterium]